MKAALIKKVIIDQGLDCESSYYTVDKIADVSSRQSADDLAKNFSYDYVMIVDQSVKKGMIFNPESNIITNVQGDTVYPPTSATENISKLQNEIAELTYNVDESKLSLEELKDYLIRKNKKNLSDYLYNHPMTYNNKTYTITEDKQSQLTGLLQAYQYAKAIGLDIELSWNETGGECTPYTFEELVEIYLQMLNIVKPIVTYQQHIEIEIRNAETKEEIQAIDITFENYDPNNNEN